MCVSCLYAAAAAAAATTTTTAAAADLFTFLVSKSAGYHWVTDFNIDYSSAATTNSTSEQQRASKQ